MAPTLFVPDYQEYYLQELHSDVSVVILDEAAAPGDAEAVRRLPGHSMVLVAFSSYCKAKLDTWSHAGASTSSGPSCKLEVQLPVPAGQQELAELLVKGMYQAQPSITDGLSQQQLLQLMLLADRFEVPKVQAAVAAAFAEVAADQLNWDTALQLLQLPLSCAQQPEFKAAHQLALQCLMQQLGDLEQVWAKELLQQRLLALPFEVLLQLLQHESTRVATENTVVYTIERWCGAQGPQPRGVEQLMRLVRMRHCTPYYAGTVMPQRSIVRRGIVRAALPLMRECCTPGGFDILEAAQCSVLQKYPAWSAEKRPRSERQPVLEWRLPLDTLQAAAQQLFRTTRAAVVDYSETCVVRGQPMHIKALLTDTCNREGTNTRALHLGLYLRLLELPRGGVRIVEATISMLALRAGADCCKTFNKAPMSQETEDWGFTSFLCLGTERSWPSMKAELYRKELVHAGGPAAAAQGQAQGRYLHIKVQVDELL